MDVVMFQGENSITYSELDAQTPFRLDVVANEEVTIRITKDVEPALAFTLHGELVPFYGAQGNPINLTELENTVNAEGTLAGSQTWFQAYFGGTTMVVTGNDAFSVTVDGETIDADAGVVSVPVVTAAPRAPFLFAIDRIGTYTISFVYPVGTYMNPEVLTDPDEIRVNIAEGNDQGYYYTWTAADNGILTLACPQAGAGYNVILTNQNTYEMAWLSDSTDGTVSLKVTAGDVVTIQVAAEPDTNWKYPALQTVLDGSFDIRLTGDLDGVFGVNTDDAIYLLRHVLLPELFPVDQNVDYDRNGWVNEDDAIYLLNYVLMPEIFPL